MPARQRSRQPRRTAPPTRTPDRAGAPRGPLSRCPHALEAALIAAVVLCWGVVAGGIVPPGVTWDETFYIVYGDAHVRGVGAVAEELAARPPFALPRAPRPGFDTWTATIWQHWSAGSEHPPLFTVSLGLAHGALRSDAGSLDPVAARGAGTAWYALLATAVFLFTAGRWGAWAGRLAVICLVAMPRVFAHAQVAAGDLPMAVTWFLAVWTFVRALEKPGTGRTALAGLALGAALLTKMNALFLPVILTPWAVAVYRRRALRPLLITYAVGAALFVACWPWMWVDTAEHLRAYLQRGTARGRILVYYFHQAQQDIAVPWHYPVVMMLVTVPVGVLAGATYGAVRWLRKAGRRALVALVLANVAVPLAIFAIPGVPVYDGVRLYLHVFPFVACLAGIGAAEAVSRAVTRGMARRVALGAILAAALLQVVPTFATAPFGMSYYNLLVGGPRGAERLGFETTYWGDAMDLVFWRDIAASIPRGSLVAFSFMPADQIRPYYDERLLRAGFRPVRYAKPAAAGPPFEYLIVISRKAYFDDYVTGLSEGATPVVERRLRFFGSVPLCSVYDVRRETGSRSGGIVE